MTKNLHLLAMIFLMMAFFSNFVLKASYVPDKVLTDQLTQGRDNTMISLEEVGYLEAKEGHLPFQNISQSSAEEAAVVDIDNSNKKDQNENCCTSDPMRSTFLLIVFFVICWIVITAIVIKFFPIKIFN